MIRGFTGDHRFLSNMWPCSVERFGRTFGAVENAYQAAKTQDEAVMDEIQAASPSEAKAIGRRALHLPGATKDWFDIQVLVMYECLVQKFQDPALRAALLATGQVALVEGNSWGDRFWGQVFNGRSWEGLNMLGCLLMLVRSQVRTGALR